MRWRRLGIAFVVLAAAAGGCVTWQSQQPVQQQSVSSVSRLEILPIESEATSLPWDLGEELTSLVGSGSGGCEHYLSVRVLDYRLLDESVVATVLLRVLDPDGLLVSQEELELSHRVPKTNHLIDYTAQGWGSSEYIHTPLAVAHARFAREISEAIS